MKLIRLTIIVGVVTGLLIAGFFLTHPKAPVVSGVVLADCEGALDAIVLQYTTEAGDLSAPVYAQLIPALPKDVTIYVVCPSPDEFGDFLRRTGLPETRATPLFTAHAMSTWSRDRWAALANEDETTTLLAPRGEAGAQNWPQRAGDAKIADELGILLDGVDARTSILYFDGGDIVADTDRAYVTPALATRNIQKTVRTREELLTELETELGKPVTLLNPAPGHHAGMFMMPIGAGRVMVGDPKIAAALMGAEEFETLLPEGADFRIETLATFEAVAAQVAATGTEVIRMPIVPSPDGRSYLAYLNVILDDRDGQRTVYMPTYQGAETLNEYATTIWESAGYTVVPIDCTSAYQHGGSLRCLVNVLTRK
jgi:hypothetical protein